MPSDWINVKSYRAGLRILLAILFVFAVWLNKIPRLFMKFFAYGLSRIASTLAQAYSISTSVILTSNSVTIKYTVVCIFLRRFIYVRESLIFL
jgi:hypothetical protein